MNKETIRLTLSGSMDVNEDLLRALRNLSPSYILTIELAEPKKNNEVLAVIEARLLKK